MLCAVAISTECARKPTAEDFPRNFALIRLSEKTKERLQKEKEEKAHEDMAQKIQEIEIAKLQ